MRPPEEHTPGGRAPSLLDALIPLVSLVALIGGAIALFGL